MEMLSTMWSQIITNLPQVMSPRMIKYSSIYQQVHPLSSPGDKVVFVLGCTGAGKSKLAIDLAVRFNGEVINSDKMQVYDGLSITTNKVTDEESAGIPHHLIGGVHPDAEFSASDFRRAATTAVESVVARGRLPIIAGGSNSYIEELVDGEGGKFRSKYECCFVWIDVKLSVLHSYVSERVEKMVEMGLVAEARDMFDPRGDYSRGVRRSIGIREMDKYFRSEGMLDEGARARLLEEAIDEIKENTRELTCNQLAKIRRFWNVKGWVVHRVDATEAFQKRRNEREFKEAWSKVAEEESVDVIQNFFNKISK